MKQERSLEKGKHRRSLKAAVFAAVAGGSMALLGSLPSYAAVLSVGNPGAPFGGFVCADVRGGDIAPDTPIQAYDCQANPDQQYAWYGPTGTIRALGGQRCVDVFGAGTTPGTPVDSAICNGTVAQNWYYLNGHIINPHSGLCLDAGNMENMTQLIVNTCNDEPNQQWQIK
jgi:non-reducing end alpha-L-arabinofuranosidase